MLFNKVGADVGLMKRPRVEKNLEQLNRNPLNLELPLPE